MLYTYDLKLKEQEKNNKHLEELCQSLQNQLKKKTEKKLIKKFILFMRKKKN